jgi:hypothetical protein
VPGHGDNGRPHLLAAVPDYLEQLREATWRRPDAGMSEQAIAEQVRAVMTQRHAAPLDLARQDGLGDDALTALTVFLAIYLGHARALLAMEIIHARGAVRLSAAAGGTQETATVN